MALRNVVINGDNVMRDVEYALSETNSHLVYLYGEILTTTTTTTTIILPFKMTIDTTQPGSASDTFILPTYGVGYDAYIDWGDNSGIQNITGTPGNVSHTYSSPGIYQISISGAFPRIFFNSIGDRLKLKTIDQWGSIQWDNMMDAFAGCTGMTGNYIDLPNTSNVTDMSQMFYNCANFNSSVNFDTSNVINMNAMFNGCTKFNQSVSNFDTSNATSMNAMFAGCSIFNQSVSNFNTSNVIDMSQMFFGCTNFNQSVSNFDTSKVTNMSWMFVTCLNFNQSVSNFNTSNVTNMGLMFAHCTNFNQSVSNFDTSNVTDMQWMFLYCTNFNQSVSNFDTSNVTTMFNMFANCTNFNQSVSNFDTSNVTDMNKMFYNCTNFKQSLATFTMSAVTDVTEMLYGCNINNIGGTINYDNTLISWAGQILHTGLNFHGGSSQYSDCNGKVAHDYLTVTDLWTITDGGMVYCSTTTTTLAPTTTTTTYPTPKYNGPTQGYYVNCPVSNFTYTAYFQINGSGFSFFGYTGNPWKTLIITSFNLDYDNDGNSLFTLRDGASTISSGMLPYSIDISSYTTGQNSTINLYYDDPTGIICNSSQIATMSFYIQDINDVSGNVVSTRMEMLHTVTTTTTTTLVPTTTTTTTV